MMRADSPQRQLRALAAALGLLGLLGWNHPAVGQERAADSSEAMVNIRDSAHLFNAELVEKLRSQLVGIARDVSVPLRIETVESLRGQTIEEASLQRAMHSGQEGLYVLVAKDEKKLEVRVSRR